MCLGKSCLYFSRPVNGDERIRVTMNHDHRKLEGRKQRCRVSPFCHCLECTNVGCWWLPFHGCARIGLQFFIVGELWGHGLDHTADPVCSYICSGLVTSFLALRSISKHL